MPHFLTAAGILLHGGFLKLNAIGVKIMQKPFSVFLAITLLPTLSLSAFAEEQPVYQDEYCGIEYAVPASWEPVDDEMSGAYYTEISCEGQTETAWCWIEFYVLWQLDSSDMDLVKEHFTEMLKRDFDEHYLEMGSEDITFAGQPGFMYSFVSDDILYAAHCTAVNDILICVWAELPYGVSPLISHELYDQVMIVLDSMDISGFDRDAALGLPPTTAPDTIKDI